MYNYPIHTVEMLDLYPKLDQYKVRNAWTEIRGSFVHKIIVLDDDPTGVQTVHGISVYTNWELETIETGFRGDNQLFFLLTNSRAFTAAETKRVHRDIAERIEATSQKLGVPYILISRSDSTLRGHYPLETEMLKKAVEEKSRSEIDGEIILPFFKEGGRYTFGDVHYVQEDELLIPAGETEFARDRTFGYKASHLGEWIEEKTQLRYKKECVTYISVESLRSFEIEKISEQLMSIANFNKIVVNAITEDDIRVFSIAMIKAIKNGKRFIFRTASAFPKVIGDIPTRPILTKEELLLDNTYQNTGGLVIVGSHVKKTTEQLRELQKLDSLHFIEFNAHLATDKDALLLESRRVRKEAEKRVSKGVTTVIYTRRDRLDLGKGKEEEELKISVVISEAVTSIVSNFSVCPKYLIAKGGITSSDIGTKGLRVKRATVAGQIAPGIPVWKTGEESTFPNLTYVVFPGNVGVVSTLKEVVQKLEGN